MILMTRSLQMLRHATLILCTIATTGVAFGADLPVAYIRRPVAQVQVYAQPAPDSLISSFPSTPILPGSSTLPGYYGTSHSYSYDGPYYGGPYTPYWDRLPYACGVYGYC